MDDLLKDFLTETNESLERVDAELVRFEQEPNNSEILANIFRLVHTIKGTCGFLGLARLETLAHAAEALMDRFRSGLPVTSDAVSLVLATVDRIKVILDAIEAHEREPNGDDGELIAQLHQLTRPVLVENAAPVAIEASETEPPPIEAAASKPQAAGGEQPSGEDERGERLASRSIRVQVDTLDRLMTTVSELVLTRNQLLDSVRRHENSDLEIPLQRLSNVTSELQDAVMKTRMQPIGNAWQKLPRIVRDLSAELGKRIELEMHGADVELDRQVLELVKDPLTHLVRNCADHGIESPGERLAAGKSEHGTIRLSAWHQGGQIIIEIADDGRGLDMARIRVAAIERGLVSEQDIAAKSETEICNLIFTPGFTTAGAVSSISGRGVGMDVVRTNVEQIGGTVDLKSIPGAGTTFTIKIPLTLAIVSALIVEAGSERFAIPQLSVLELVRVASGAEQRIEHIDGAPVLRLRTQLLPLIGLRQILNLDAADTDGGFVVVLQTGRSVFGIVVDGVFHTEEIVIKPLSAKLRHIAAFSGTTILGDGTVIMIVDPNGIAQALGRSAQPAPSHDAQINTHTATADEDTTPLLVFRSGSRRPKAVRLSLISRLEEIDCRRIEAGDDYYLVHHRDKLMPLVPFDARTAVKAEGVQPTLVFSDGDCSLGLAVDEIVDIVQQRLTIELAGERPGILGHAVVKGVATEIVDLGHVLPQAYADWFGHRDRQPARMAPRVLLIDDTDLFRDALASVIEAAGYEVAAASSAREALAAIRSGARADLIVTAVEMPEMDGYEFAAALHKDPDTAAIPVIGISPVVSAAAFERGRHAGFRDVVGKFDQTRLIAALNEHSDPLHWAA
jgi:two-component system, chemotaxis family, sensor kinase CheA